MSQKISVALCTCNGARYLPALLDSLALQTLLPIELIACDDASDDDSVSLLETFAARAPFSVRIFRNPQRLGITENFSRTIAACAGEWIALADQDDVWYPKKLETLAQALSRPSVVAAFTDAKVVDADLVPLGYTMWQRVRFTPAEQGRLAQWDGFAVLLKHRIVTGATLAFKSALRKAALPIPDGWSHDAWLSLIAAANQGLSAIPEPLIAYRQHADNAVGGIRRTLWQEACAALALDRADWYRSELALWHALAARLPTVRPELAEKIFHLEARATLPATRWRRFPGVLREVMTGRYARHARNWGSIGIDLLLK